MAGLMITTDATVQPISLSLVKQQLRVDSGDTSRDALLTLYIQNARETVESLTARSFIQRTYREYFDAFPGYALPPAYGVAQVMANVAWNSRDWLRRTHLELSRSPLTTFTQIQYLDPTDLTGATIVTLDPTLYYVNAATEQQMAPARVMPSPLAGNTWPRALWRENSVWIDYIAGYSTDSSLVPASAQNAMLMLVDLWNENPDVMGDSKMAELPYAIRDMIKQNKIFYQP